MLSEELKQKWGFSHSLKILVLYIANWSPSLMLMFTWVRLSEIDVSLLPTFLSILLEDSVSYYFIARKTVTYEFFKWNYYYACSILCL